MSRDSTTALPGKTCLVHGSYVGSACPTCSTGGGLPINQQVGSPPQGIWWTSKEGIAIRETCGCGAEITISTYILAEARNRYLDEFRKNHAGCRQA